MDSALRRRLSALLIVFGVLGLVAAAALLLFGLVAVGIVRPTGVPFLMYASFAREPALLIVGTLSALFCVAGRRAGWIEAALAAFVVIGYLVAEWVTRVGVTISGDPQVYYALVIALSVGTGLISVLALVAARTVRHEGD